MHYLLFYEVVSDYVARRAPYRGAHLERVRAAHERGDLVLAGALASPADGAVLVFRGATASAAEAFAAGDPYVLNGVVTSWRVRAWSTVVGDGIELPPPEAIADLASSTPRADEPSPGSGSPSKSTREGSS